jgi:hypothetical protein
LTIALAEVNAEPQQTIHRYSLTAPVIAAT